MLFIDVYLLKYTYLETRSRCVNTSFIIKECGPIRNQINYRPNIGLMAVSAKNTESVKRFSAKRRGATNFFVKIFAIRRQLSFATSCLTNFGFVKLSRFRSFVLLVKYFLHNGRS